MGILKVDGIAGAIQGVIGYTDQRSDGDTERKVTRHFRECFPKVTQTNDPMGILKARLAVTQPAARLCYTDQRSDGDTESVSEDWWPVVCGQVTQTNDPMGILKVLIFLRWSLPTVRAVLITGGDNG